MAMLQPRCYTQQFHVNGDLKIRRHIDIKHQLFALFTYWGHTFSDKMALIKDKEVEHSCHED
jgi:hypothetical protein